MTVYQKHLTETEDILTQNNESKYRISLTLTYSRTLSSVKEPVKKRWNIL